MSLPTRDSRTADLPAWARWQAGAVLLQVHAQPGARRTQLAGTHGERLKIALHAPPVDGKANEELLRFLAGALAVRRSAVRLAGGLASREKSVAVECAEDGAGPLVARLLAAMGR